MTARRKPATAPPRRCCKCGQLLADDAEARVYTRIDGYIYEICAACDLKERTEDSNG